jgi:hypothetical protein
MIIALAFYENNGKKLIDKDSLLRKPIDQETETGTETGPGLVEAYSFI